MKNKHLLSLFFSFLIFWAICVIFNSVAITGEVMLSKTFISPLLTFTTAAKYMHLGMGLSSTPAYILATLLLLFLWASLYFFIYSLLRAIEIKGSRGR